MTSKGVIENINEFLSVVDPLTKGIIYCVNRNLLRKPGWCKQWLSSNEIKLIDVTETIPYSSKKAFTHDTFVNIGDEDTFIDLLIDFACMIHGQELAAKPKNNKTNKRCNICLSENIDL